MKENKFEILWPEELQAIDYSRTIATEEQNGDLLVLEPQHSSSFDTALVVGGILILGGLATYTQHRTSRDTALEKAKLN